MIICCGFVAVCFCGVVVLLFCTYFYAPNAPDLLPTREFTLKELDPNHATPINLDAYRAGLHRSFAETEGDYLITSFLSLIGNI